MFDFSKLFPVSLSGMALLLLSACNTAQDPNNGSSQPIDTQSTSITLLEQKLLVTIEMEEQLDAAAAEPDADAREIERRFQIVAREYEGIIARNPESLEANLLYGKLLARYGDREGARLQFLACAHIDPNIAVIHQQLSNYYAEEEDYTRALAYALNAVRLEPETAAYHFGLGQILTTFRGVFISEEVFSSYQIDEDILGAFDTARTLEPDSLNLQFRYGEAFYDVAYPQWEVALAHWESLSTHPNLSAMQADAVSIHRARCLDELGRDDEARELLLSVQSSSLTPDSSDSPPPSPPPLIKVSPEEEVFPFSP